MEHWILLGIVLFLIFLIYLKQCDCRRGFRVGGQSIWGTKACCKQYFNYVKDDTKNSKLQYVSTSNASNSLGCNLVWDNIGNNPPNRVPDKVVWNSNQESGGRIPDCGDVPDPRFPNAYSCEINRTIPQIKGDDPKHNYYECNGEDTCNHPNFKCPPGSKKKLDPSGIPCKLGTSGKCNEFVCCEQNSDGY